LRNGTISLSAIFFGMKIFEKNIYLFLNLPGLEILVLNSDGNILDHYYNFKDFQLMWWKDFDIKKEKGNIVFYILGCSMSDDKPEMNDFNVYRMVVGKKNNEKSDNKKN
jgi:hypothetical protein